MFTPEELTAMRRRERMHAKIERARLAVKAGTQLPDGIVALGGTLTEEEEQLLAKRAEQEIDAEEEEEYGKHIPGLIYLGKGPRDDQRQEQTPTADADVEPIDEATIARDVRDMEWLHVSPVEIFFLAGMLGVLEVRDEQVRVCAAENGRCWRANMRNHRTILSHYKPSTHNFYTLTLQR